MLHVYLEGGNVDDFATRVGRESAKDCQLSRNGLATARRCSQQDVLVCVIQSVEYLQPAPDTSLSWVFSDSRLPM